jgi:hypothetical protein
LRNATTSDVSAKRLTRPITPKTQTGRLAGSPTGAAFEHGAAETRSFIAASAGTVFCDSIRLLMCGE